MRDLVIVAAMTAALVAGSARAESVRSISEKANNIAHERITSVGAGPSAEAIDFETNLSDFGTNHRAFSVQVENEDTTAANVLLFKVVKDGASVAATELTTPGTDGSSTDPNVIRLRGGKTLSFDCQCDGIILQSGDHTNLVDVNVIWSY